MAQSPVGGRTTVKYFRTREACFLYTEKRLANLIKQGKRVFVGWDFVFGYPKGLAKALKLKGKTPWRRIWGMVDRLILDYPNNHNNRFTVGAELNRRISVGSGPFWGVPAGQSGIFLGSKKDFLYPVVNKRALLREKRMVEERVPKMQPGWKLAYSGSVGSQSLLGIPRVHALAHSSEKLEPHSMIWPFDSQFDQELPQNGPLVLHAEIYPSLMDLPRKDEIVDREQVRTYVNWLKKEQSEDRLGSLLAGPADLTKKQRKRAVKHEGWVFGVK